MYFHSGECRWECRGKIAAEIYTCRAASTEKPVAYRDGLWSQLVWNSARRPPLVCMHLPTHLHCGLNNIIKNDHQRAHCKQITLVGAWRTNSAKDRTRSEAICGSGESASARSFFFYLLFSADISTRISLTSGGDASAAAERHVLPDEDLCFVLRPPLRSLVSPESFLLTLAAGLSH